MRKISHVGFLSCAVHNMNDCFTLNDNDFIHLHEHNTVVILNREGCIEMILRVHYWWLPLYGMFYCILVGLDRLVSSCCGYVNKLPFSTNALLRFLFNINVVAAVTDTYVYLLCHTGPEYKDKEVYSCFLSTVCQTIYIVS